ncbi:hypothetical protein SETIT_8G013400v2 [Setaria italica]|uniref:KIB1-4 beta-propeller domain-containing protein n=1 Tax=Setaria italica TaxID=4555 RepID=A0A368S388_SETIT|nr:hypothetical protein SETIT_8G013400v2 [Setaria italica]
MAGIRRRRGGREPSPQQGAQFSPLADATHSTREVTIVERPSKNACHASGSTSSTSSGPHSLPSHLCVPSASRLSTSNLMVLIFVHIAEEHCLLVDAYTGAKLKAPKLPCNNKLGLSSGIGVLTAPFSSPNSRLLLFSKAFMFAWQVGTNSWSVLPLALGHERIHQIVFFKGHILVIDTLLRLHTVQLTPNFSIKRVKIMWELLWNLPVNPWLVACGDMLLMVDLSFRSLCSDEKDDFSRIFEVFHLDFSVKPAKWVKMEKLENQALFVSLDKRNPAFCCMNPERWGGRSNCIYVARLFDDPDETWTAVELGQSVPCHSTIHSMVYGLSFPPDYSQIGSLWLFPSLVYGARQ